MDDGNNPILIVMLLGGVINTGIDLGFQVANNLGSGQSFSQSVSHLNYESAAQSFAVGAALGGLGATVESVIAKGFGVVKGVGDVARDGGSASNATLRGTNNPVVKEAIEYGKQQHKLMDYGKGALKEQKLGNYRVDAINRETKTIYELKPNTPQSTSRGTKQLENYVNTANKLLGGGYTGVLKTYRSLVNKFIK